MTETAYACPACALEVPEGLTYCPRCRAAAEDRDYDPGETDRHERHYVISLVVLSLGALALPRLWSSRAFTTAGKAGLSVVGVLNTVGVVVVLYYFLGVWVPAQIERTLSQGGF